ncbi:hypothetical protein HY732_00060 [Candidatus Uhrbacteria bacterium]|nr:hypothetical protein [Candidatus Uhrbacteria bacterium]
MTPFFEQLTHDLSTLEREVMRMRRELIRFRFTAADWRTQQTSPRVAEIAAMGLPVGEWEEMEREIHG